MLAALLLLHLFLPLVAWLTLPGLQIVTAPLVTLGRAEKLTVAHEELTHVRCSRTLLLLHSIAVLLLPSVVSGVSCAVDCAAPLARQASLPFV